MSRVFIDTNVPMYAAGKSHHLKEPCQRVILAIAKGELNAVTDTEVFQEILYRYLHLGERKKGFQVFDHFHRLMAGNVLAMEEEDIWKARQLAEQNARLSLRDLFHLAVMFRHNITKIVTADKDFDSVPEIQRIDPLTFS
jgi:predicted nucleic acid-binding protein